MKKPMLKGLFVIGVASILFAFQNCAPTNFVATGGDPALNASGGPGGLPADDPNAGTTDANGGNTSGTGGATDSNGGTAGTGTGGTGGTGTGGTGGTGGSDPTMRVFPLISFFSTTCLENQPCPFVYRLDKAWAADTSFNWATKDDAHVVYPDGAQAGVNYVSATGSLTIRAGTTSGTVFVQAMTFRPGMRIYLNRTNCRYNNAAIACSAFQ